MRSLKLSLVISMTVFSCVACTVTETTNSNANHSANQNSSAPIVVVPANANAPAAGENANAASKNSNAAGAPSAASNTASNIYAAALFNNESSPKCASCHQPDGKGKQGIKDIPNFTDAAWQKKTTDNEITETIKNGHKPMPAYKDKLSDDQIKALVAYVRKFAR